MSRRTRLLLHDRERHVAFEVGDQSNCRAGCASIILVAITTPEASLICINVLRCLSDQTMPALN
jgi:hypothetical protein